MRSFSIDSILAILYSIPAIFIALTFHEFAHAFAAVRMGDNTPRMQERLTLDPMAHIDWMGLLMFVLMGFGWAKPVQVNVRNFKNPKRDDIIVSLAGPLSNLLLAFVFQAVILILYRFGMTNQLAWNFIYPLVSLNLALTILNLIPLPPLDGWHVLKSVLPYKYWQNLFQFERYGFIVIFLLSFIGVLGFVISIGSSLLYAGINALLFFL